MSTPDHNRALAIAVATYAIDSCSQLLKQIAAHNAASPRTPVDHGPYRIINPEPWHAMRGEARQLLSQVRRGELTDDQITERVQQFSAKLEKHGRLLVTPPTENENRA